MLFRFDDICYNTDIKKVLGMVCILRERFPLCPIQFSVSLFASDNAEQKGKQSEFVFKPIFKAYSDHRMFYDVKHFFKPISDMNIQLLSHGLIHVDHRLLHRSAQEMSICVSCSILGSRAFVPPFNKWNADTENICAEHGISLIKFEDGWLGAEYNNFDHRVPKWYTHPFNWTVTDFEKWLDNDNR